MRLLLAITVMIPLVSGCAGNTFSGASPARKQGSGSGTGLPVPDTDGTSGGGGLQTDEQGRKIVTDLKLSGTWGFDGCGTVTFDLTSGQISVQKRPTSPYFGSNLSFNVTRQDGSVSSVSVASNGSSAIPDWQPVCLKTQVTAPRLTPQKTSGRDPVRPVEITGGAAGSKKVDFLFDDDGGNSPCASNGKDMGGAVNVDPSSFSLQLTSCN